MCICVDLLLFFFIHIHLISYFSAATVSRVNIFLVLLFIITMIIFCVVLCFAPFKQSVRKYIGLKCVRAEYTIERRGNNCTWLLLLKVEEKKYFKRNADRFECILSKKDWPPAKPVRCIRIYGTKKNTLGKWFDGKKAFYEKSFISPDWKRKRCELEMGLALWEYSVYVAFSTHNLLGLNYLTHSIYLFFFVYLSINFCGFESNELVANWKTTAQNGKTAKT